MDQLGKLVRANREKKGETIGQLAKRLKCTEAFAKNIETSPHVPISDRIVTILKNHYKLPSATVARAITQRDKLGKRYYKKYQKAA